MSWPWSRIFRLQWSLRTLLVATTLVAAGVAVVTRWPFEVVEPRREFLWNEFELSPLATKGGTVNSSEERASYRGMIRQYRTRHGRSELFAYNKYSFNKLRIVERHYRNGVLHGSYREFYASGQVRTEGEYRSGHKQGRWLNYRQQDRDAAQNDYLLTQHWDLGRPHGLWQWENGYGQVSLSAEYDQGRVILVNDEAVIDWQDRLRQVLQSQLTNDEWQKKLAEVGDISGADYRPVASSHRWYSDQYFEQETPFLGLNEEIYYPRVERVPREVHLAHTLHVIKLAFTVRHNIVFLTTPDRIGSEHDPTGVSQLEVPEGSLLAQSLAAEIEMNSWELGNYNGRQALDFLRKDCRVPLDDTALHNTLQPRDEDRAWIRFSNSRTRYRVRDLLGLALFRSRCRCELVEGKLVITRQP